MKRDMDMDRAWILKHNGDDGGVDSRISTLLLLPLLLPLLLLRAVTCTPGRKEAWVCIGSCPLAALHIDRCREVRHYSNRLVSFRHPAPSPAHAPVRLVAHSRHLPYKHAYTDIATTTTIPSPHCTASSDRRYELRSSCRVSPARDPWPLN